MLERIMNKLDFIESIELTFSNIINLTKTKGEEYSRGDDQLANFKRGAEEIGISKEQILLIFLNKHMDSIKHWVKYPEISTSEPITGRIDDAILYLLLLKAMVEEGQGSIYNFITGDPLDD
jgi:hypothetical protein